MKKIKLFIKGVLLYITVLLILAFIAGIDSIINQENILAIWVSTIVLNITLCSLLITKDEIKLLCFYNRYKKHIEQL